MNVAIRGDRSRCLAFEIAPGIQLVALARGFGTIDGGPVAPFVLGRLRSEIVRRLRGRRLARVQCRPRGLLRALSAAYGRVNADIRSRTEAGDDYVTSACSLTSALLTGDAVHVAHLGITAAYVVRAGTRIELTRCDAFDTPAGPVLTRALGASAAVQVAVSSFSWQEGDALVLVPRAGEEERGLIVRYAADTSAADTAPAASGFARAARTLAVTVLFYALLCLR